MTPLFMFFCLLATTLIGRGIFNEPSLTVFRPQTSSVSGKSNNNGSGNNNVNGNGNGSGSSSGSGSSNGNDRESLMSEMEDEFEETLKKFEDLKKQEIKNQDDAKADRRNSYIYDWRAGEERLKEYEIRITESRENGKKLQDIRRQEIGNNKNLEKAQSIARAGKLKSLEEIEKQEDEAYENLKRIHTLKKQEIQNQLDFPLENQKRVADIDRRNAENRKNEDRLRDKIASKSFQKLSEAEKAQIKREEFLALDNGEQLDFDRVDEMNRFYAQMDESRKRLRDFEKQEPEALENIKRIQILKKQEIDSLIDLAKP